jgi:DNA-binding transcriptional regulator LsrR (DeoR family)
MGNTFEKIVLNRLFKTRYMDRNEFNIRAGSLGLTRKEIKNLLKSLQSRGKINISKRYIELEDW